MTSNKEIRDIERPHVADGIKEYDNPMPRWWLGLLYFTIVWSVAYMLYLHVFDGEKIEDIYMSAEQVKKQTLAEQVSMAGEVSGEDIAKLINDPQAINAGKDTYITNCSPCHGMQGQGIIGPNLTDSYWLHGGKPADVLKSISSGIPEKGMIGWQPVLGEQKVREVTAYVLTLKGSNPPDAKAPEGELADGE